VGKALARLIDFHVIEAHGEGYWLSPPLRPAVEREKTFALSAERKKAVLQVIGDAMRTHIDTDKISVSMIDAGILAALQGGTEIPDLFAAFLLPSHQIWLAKRQYDARRWAESAKFAKAALGSVNSLSPAGKVEACRLLCLSAARLNRQEDFNNGIASLRAMAGDTWARSNVHFLLGFNARLDGNLPQAERHFREAIQGSAPNISAVRELAAICLVRGELDAAETFARRAMEGASDNPFILDILLGILISCSEDKLRRRKDEISYLFAKLEEVGDEDGRSFYTTRRAEYEFKHGDATKACQLIDAAAVRTPGIFGIHALRAKIYLDRNNKSVVNDEIEKMRTVVYRDNAGERRTNMRSFLEIESEYLAACGNFQAAKEIYSNRTVFTEEEARNQTKIIDFEQSMRKK
jgi:Tfp pilus assembly protein PilF